MNEKGHRQLLLQYIIYYLRNSDTVHSDDAFIETHNGLRRQNMTRKDWEICVHWKDGSTDWIALKYLTQSYPIELADFAQLTGLSVGI